MAMNFYWTMVLIYLDWTGRTEKIGDHDPAKSTSILGPSTSFEHLGTLDVGRKRPGSEAASFESQSKL